MIEYISIEEIQKNLKDNFIIIDVRNPDELRYGMIPQAHNISSHLLETALCLEEKHFTMEFKFRKPEKDNVIVFYCRTGERAEEAAKLADKLGYTKVFYFEGILEWSKIDEKVTYYEE